MGRYKFRLVFKKERPWADAQVSDWLYMFSDSVNYYRKIFASLGLPKLDGHLNTKCEYIWDMHTNEKHKELIEEVLSMDFNVFCKEIHYIPPKMNSTEGETVNEDHKSVI